MTWQPIETAPKDGAPILVWCPDYGTKQVWIAEWQASSFTPEWNQWINARSDESEPIGDPTFWMPLPNPPLLPPDY